MPRRYRKRKNVRRKVSRRKKKTSIPRSLSLGPYLPQSMIVKHKYSTIYGLSQDYTLNTIGSNNMHNFRINSMYDPDTAIQAGDGQPRLFDEMSNFYSTYRVIGAIARVKFINLSNEPCYVYTHLGNQQFSAASNWTPAQLRELKHTKRRILHALSSGPKSVLSITTGYSPEKVEGKSKASIRGNPEFEALHGQNPLEIHYLSTCCSQVSSTLGAQENLNVQCEITIDFTAIWNDRKILDTAS